MPKVHEILKVTADQQTHSRQHRRFPPQQILACSANKRVETSVLEQRWPHSFGQFSEIFKWNVRGDHAADLIAGSVAKYASSGVRSARLEWGRFRLYKLMYSPMERRAWLTDSYAFR